MISSTLALSVLDLVPVRSGQTSSQAFAASLDLVQHADRLGYRRYWFAEHHNMASIASTTPPVLIAGAAAHTSRIRLGSGGVMLPNHSPFVVAEQFATLEAMYPGRIDLGIGRAPGSDGVVSQLLGRSGSGSDATKFPESVAEVLALASPAGATFQMGRGSDYRVQATPAATSTPQTWLLGSSDFSAQLAASMGLPYVFAHHFSGNGTSRAIQIYRDQFQPNESGDMPQVILTANVVVAPTDIEAQERAMPQLRVFARLQTGRPLIRLETVEQAKTDRFDVATEAAMAAQRDRWFVGTADEVSTRLLKFAEEHGVDEVMVSPVAGAYDGEPLETASGRIQALELLANRTLVSA